MNWKDLFAGNGNKEKDSSSLLESDLNRYLMTIQDMKRGFDAVSDHVIITDSNGNILYANQAAERNTGYSQGEMMGKNPGNLWGGGMPRDFYEKMWDAIKVKKQPFVGEVRNKRKDGTEYWQEIHISPVLWENGDIKFFIGIEPDITEKKEKEVFRNEFISIFAHQLRNPLTSVKWMLGWITNHGGLDREQQAIISKMYQSNQSLIDLVADLMAVAKMGVIVLGDAPVDVVQEVERVTAEVQSRNPSVTFSFDHEGPCMLVSNKSLIVQVLMNIITNAAEYASKTGGRVFIRLKREGNFYVCSVQDNGIGIPAADQERIYSKFFRASNAGEAKKNGTGLGLFIAKTVCMNLGWILSFKSPPASGQAGTIFFIHIPVS